MADISLLTTIRGSMLEGFYPEGWDLKKIDRCCQNPPESVLKRQSWWNKRFEPIQCETLDEFNTKMGHEIALTIRRYREQGKPLALILPVGPMGMYQWAVYFLREWGVACDHVYGFNMDEWSTPRATRRRRARPALSNPPWKARFTARWDR